MSMTPLAATDPIDRVHHHWKPDDLGDPRKFQAMGSIMRLHALMCNTIDRTLKDFGLNRNTYLMLSTVLLSPKGSRLLSNIASHMLVHPTTVTLTADKLVGMGLLTRTPHPTDRRATYATITPAGRALMKDATKALDAVDFGLPGLTPARAEKLVEMLAPIRGASGDSA